MGVKGRNREGLFTGDVFGFPAAYDRSGTCRGVCVLRDTRKKQNPACDACQCAHEPACGIIVLAWEAVSAGRSGYADTAFG